MRPLQYARDTRLVAKCAGRAVFLPNCPSQRSQAQIRVDAVVEQGFRQRNQGRMECSDVRVPLFGRVGERKGACAKVEVM